ncbi:MAG: ATP-dependent sacrificial sulfur transferase LarE [Thermoplasmata archaeon]|nr:ATP-dependent sacrificial sulfur transferase LarE [Thermoplasmata archaeon]MCI4359260.1 ATP-dependent sacrificial sulfur transferase LarE [Thermoplasmata archaeon]
MDPPPLDRTPAIDSWEPERLIRSLRASGPAVVAMSGGVDSSVVAALLVRALADRAHAVTLSGPAVAPTEVERAVEVARFLGIHHELVPVDPLASAEYRSNPANRCYFCRRVETSAVSSWGQARGISRFYDGVQSDDLGEDRPGIRAMEEAGFRHPLVDARWGKAEVRAFGGSIGLPNADQPSDACLASRVRHGQLITADLLRTVDRSEAVLRRLGFRRVRVRVEGANARVEVDPTETSRLLSDPIASEVREELATLGFGSVILDPHGYRWRPSA